MSDEGSTTRDEEMSTSRAAGHETSDVSVRVVVKFGVYLTVATIASFLLMWALFRYFDNREARSEPPPSPLASERQVFPPEPRLQLAPTTIDQLARREPPNLQEQGPIPTMKRLREEETAKLKSYGWVNKDAGIVRLPIEEAKRLALERGMFPHR